MVVDGDPLQALSDIPTRHAASAQAAAERLDGEGSRHLQQKVSCVGIERQEPTMPQEGGVAKHARQPAVGRSCTACKIGSTLLTSWSAAENMKSYVGAGTRSLGRYSVTGQQSKAVNRHTKIIVPRCTAFIS